MAAYAANGGKLARNTHVYAWAGNFRFGERKKKQKWQKQFTIASFPAWHLCRGFGGQFYFF